MGGWYWWYAKVYEKGVEEGLCRQSDRMRMLWTPTSTRTKVIFLRLLSFMSSPILFTV